MFLCCFLFQFYIIVWRECVFVDEPVAQNGREVCVFGENDNVGRKDVETRKRKCYLTKLDGTT